VRPILDLYQVHGWDSNTPLEETLRTLDDLVRREKFAISAVNLMSWQAATAVICRAPGLEEYERREYTVLRFESRYSSSRSPSHTWQSGLDPLAGGFFSGKYSATHTCASGTRFADGQFRALRKEWDAIASWTR